jgi:hypothetical protein
LKFLLGIRDFLRINIVDILDKLSPVDTSFYDNLSIMIIRIILTISLKIWNITTKIGFKKLLERCTKETFCWNYIGFGVNITGKISRFMLIKEKGIKYHLPVVKAKMPLGKWGSRFMSCYISFASKYFPYLWINS